MAVAFADLDGIQLCYECFGDPSDPTLVLVTGLGGQMIDWDADLCGKFAAEGLHVVRLDNRDSGDSSYLDEPVDILAVMQMAAGGPPANVPYLLGDMARDVVGLLDHLKVERAHIVGISLGGMIVQTVALDFPERVASLTSLSSTPSPDAAPPTAEALNALLAPPAQSREEAMDRSVQHSEIWGSPGKYDPDEVREAAGQRFDRNSDPMGAARQFAAIIASGSREDRLRALKVPTLVIHGTADTLIPQAGGEATAAAIPNAELKIVEGMGHDLVRPNWPILVELITTHAKTATATAKE